MENTAITSSFHFKSLKDTLSILGCSKFYLYKLIHKGVIKQYYLEKDQEGKPTGKPYFNLKEVENNFFTAEN